jgi:hypothetical protein
MQREDMRVLKSGSGLYLREKSLDAQRRRDVRVQNFYCDVALVPEIPREIDAGHPAATKLAVDAIASASSAGRCAIPESKSAPNRSAAGTSNSES